MCFNTEIKESGHSLAAWGWYHLGLCPAADLTLPFNRRGAQVALLLADCWPSDMPWGRGQHFNSCELQPCVLFDFLAVGPEFG